MESSTVERLVAWAAIDFAAYLSSAPSVPRELDFVPLLTEWAAQNGLTLEAANPQDWDRFRTQLCSTSLTPSRNSSNANTHTSNSSSETP